MHEFHYDFMKSEVDIFTLLYTDTDSFISEIIGEDFYGIMYKHKEFFDLSNQPKDSKCFCNDNKKVPGKLTDEYWGTAIYEFVGPKPKMYSIRDVNNCEKSVCKEHNSNIGHAEFIDFHSNKKVIRHIMRGIKFRDHIITTYGKIKYLYLLLMISGIFLMIE